MSLDNEQKGFAQFGVEFQEKLIQALLQDHKWSQQMSEVIKLEYFEQKHLTFLADKYFSYFKKYKCFPSFAVLISVVKDELRTGTDIQLRDSIVEFLKRIRSNPDVGDLVYVKERGLQFCRRQAMKDALETSIDLINSEKYDSVVTIMKQALAVGTLPSVGHKFFDELDARLEIESRNTVPTGIPELDQNGILCGGMGSGELHIVAANAGVGKSHMLVQIGANVIKTGLNVVHYTFELNEKYVGIRYDSNMCDIASNDVRDYKEKIKLKYKENKYGKLIIKEYPTNTCGVLTIRNHLERLEATENFKPNLVIIDYADIMKSSRQYDSLRHELKLVYEELRTLAQDLELPVLTASQANRDSAKSDIIGLENMSEAYGKAMVADFVVSLSRKPLEKATGHGRIFIAKNRFGKDGIVFPIKIDTAKSRLEIIDSQPMNAYDTGLQDQDTLKAALREKWREVQNDKELGLKNS